MSLVARDGLPGTNWLTFIGERLGTLRAIDVRGLEAFPWTDGSRAMTMPQGLLLRASDSPTPGDLNRLSYPRAYAQVAQQLAKWFVPKPPELWEKPFAPPDSAEWFRRFVQPEAW